VEAVDVEGMVEEVGGDVSLRTSALPQCRSEQEVDAGSFNVAIRFVCNTRYDTIRPCKGTWIGMWSQEREL